MKRAQNRPRLNPHRKVPVPESTVALTGSMLIGLAKRASGD